ncbi:hypothetical protein KI387_016614, partial [Taxus chinensis]
PSLKNHTRLFDYHHNGGIRTREALMAREYENSKKLGLWQSLIPPISKFQGILSQLDCESVIDLPQVAVVGSQRSGISSVLEALVGRDFLPRGLDKCQNLLRSDIRDRALGFGSELSIQREDASSAYDAVDKKIR